MSKKKNKFKKTKKYHPQERPTKGSSSQSAEKRESTINAQDSNQTIESFIPEEVADSIPDHYNTDKYDYVKADIKKILTIMGSIIIVLFASLYIGQKTTVLDTLGSWIYKILNIQTL